MIFVTILLKQNVMLSCSLQTEAVEFMKLKKNDVYEDFYKDKDFFDFNDCPQNSKFFYLFNKNVLGKMKDEFKGKIISKFCWIKFKNVFFK